MTSDQRPRDIKLRAAKLDHLRQLIADGDSSGFEPMASDEFEQIKREGRDIRAASAMSTDRLRELVREANEAGEEPDENFDIESLIKEAAAQMLAQRGKTSS